MTVSFTCHSISSAVPIAALFIENLLLLHIKSDEGGVSLSETFFPTCLVFRVVSVFLEVVHALILPPHNLWLSSL